jgi:uncharacterized membrane protein YfcA
MFIIIFVIFFTAIFQSIFGVGVLLIGTPLLILSGFDYVEVISYTVPCSLVISLAQIISFPKKIELNLFKSAFIFSLPSLIFGLLIINYISNLLPIFMGVILLLSTYDFIFNKFISPKSSLKQINIFLLITGFIHGISSMGGGLLPKVIATKCANKSNRIATTASIYLLFQLIQIIYIFISGKKIFLDSILISILTCTIAYFIVGKNLYNKISILNYTNYLNYFLRIVALFLIFYKIKIVFF